MKKKELENLLELARHESTNKLASEIFKTNYGIEATGRYLMQLIWKRSQGSDWVAATSKKQSSK